MFLQRYPMDSSRTGEKKNCAFAVQKSVSFICLQKYFFMLLTISVGKVRKILAVFVR